MRIRSVPLIVLTMAFGSVAALTATAPTAAAAGPDCKLFAARVYDQLNPATAAQSLSARADHAAITYDAGFTTNRPYTVTASLRAGSFVKAVHKLYRASNKNVFYSHDSAEIKNAVTKLGYADQGVVFHAATKAAPCLKPVYSFLKAGKHRFVTAAAERASLTAQGWKQEKVRFYLGGPASAFTFAIMPDTQQEVLQASDRRFVNRSRWLGSTRPVLDTRFVLHTGDIVNWDTDNHEQYVRARDAMAPLNGVVPYMLAPGNHDTAAVGPGGSAADPERSDVLVRDTSSFNRYLAPGVRANGRFEAGKTDNSYATVSAGGYNWLVLTLELWPRPGAVSWARSVVASHPKHNVIVITHSYLTSSGGIERTNGGYGSTSPQYLYDNLIKVYPNIKMTFSGHTGTAGYRRDVGAKGNVIHNYLLTMHSTTTNPVRLVEVNLKANTVASYVYAPHTKTNYPAYFRAPAATSWIR
jgi:hypothetical protein